jgi:hypothetical protein
MQPFTSPPPVAATDDRGDICVPRTLHPLRGYGLAKAFGESSASYAYFDCTCHSPEPLLCICFTDEDVYLCFCCLMNSTIHKAVAVLGLHLIRHASLCQLFAPTVVSYNLYALTNHVLLVLLLLLLLHRCMYLRA